MVSLSHCTIYVDLAPVYERLAQSMTLVGAESPVFYLKSGEYDGLIRQIVFLGLLQQSGQISRYTAQNTLGRMLDTIELVGYDQTPEQQEYLKHRLWRTHPPFDAVREAIPIPLNPLSLIAPKRGTIWAIITGA